MNHPTIGYVLCGPAGSYFSICTRVSISTLRLTNPHLKVVLLVDPKTHRSLLAGSDPVLNLPDEVMPVETPYQDDMMNSRYLKIIMRYLVPEGDLLYIDNDTVIRGPIDGIPGGDCDLAGVRNHSQDLKRKQISPEDQDILNRMNVTIHRDIYLNAGLVCSLQIYRDQPSFNAAINEVDANILFMDDRYNAQFLTRNQTAANGIILHYYSSYRTKPVTNFDDYVIRVLNGEPFSDKAIRQLVRARHPWRTRIPFLDEWYGRYLTRKPYLTPHDWNWLQGKRLQSIWDRLSFVISSFLLHLRKKAGFHRSDSTPD
ncbi:MAG: hypothetical protein HUU10_09405 [Bacteroidetes bacterium]|nr:hypothetical protein [Bacteroidota bacterium]